MPTNVSGFTYFWLVLSLGCLELNVQNVTPVSAQRTWFDMQ